MAAATIPDPAVGLVVTAMVYASMVYARVFLSYVLLTETLFLVKFMVVVANGGRAHFMIYLECAAVRRLTAALNAVLCIAVVVDDAPCRIRIQSPIIEARSGVLMHVKCSAPAQHRLPLGLSCTLVSTYSFFAHFQRP